MPPEDNDKIAHLEDTLNQLRRDFDDDWRETSKLISAVNLQLGQMQTTMQSEFQELRTRTDETKERLKKIGLSLYGDGNGVKGVMTRLYDLERRENARTRIFWLIASALIVLACKGAWEIMQGLPKLLGSI